MKHAIKMALGLCLPMLVSSWAMAEPDPLYDVHAVQTLKGTGSSWGFAALQPGRPYLFIARRENGLTVFDVDEQHEVQTLANSAGANAVAFAPKLGKAYVANMDGSLGVVDLKTLQVVRRIAIDPGNLNNLVYLPRSERLAITSGRRDQHSTVYLLDPQSDEVVGSVRLPARKLDAPIALGDDRLVVPLRDEDQVAVLEGSDLTVKHLWRFPGCSKPSAVAADEGSGTLFVACRGKTPVLVAADLNDGSVRDTVPAGRSINALAYDSVNGRVLAPSGPDAELRIFQLDKGRHLVPFTSIGTRQWAHNMVFDGTGGRAYLLSMNFSQPLDGNGAPLGDPIFQADTFNVITLQPHPARTSTDGSR